jgi:hypothetical protein
VIRYQTNGVDSASSQVRTVTFGRGNSEDQYLVGDFAGIGRAALAVRRGNQIVYQTNGITSKESQVASITFGEGNPQDQYFAGHFSGAGHDEFAVRGGDTIFYEKDRVTDTGSVGVIRFGNGDNSNW